MSITRSDEIGVGRSGSSSYENKRLITRDTRVWRVQASDQYHTAAQILAEAMLASPDPIPGPLATHPYDPTLRVKMRNANPEDGEGVAATYWLVVANYDNQTSDQDATDAETPPLDRRTRWKVRFNGVEKPLDFDEEGTPILNAVGDPFDPTIVETEYHPVFIAVKNYDADDLDAIAAITADYTNCANTDDFLGRPAGSWYINAPSVSDELVENEVRYREIEWPFELKGEYEFSDTSVLESTPEPWDTIVLNVGFNHYKTANQKDTKARIAGSNEPRKLKEDGTLFAASDDPDYFYRVFRTKKRRPFSALGLI